jgi:hypothetical protein
LFSVEFAKILVFDLLLANGDLLSVGERFGHPLFWVALFVLLNEDGRLHLLEGTTGLGVEWVEEVDNAVVGASSLDLVVIVALVTVVSRFVIIIDHLLEEVCTQLLVWHY